MAAAGRAGLGNSRRVPREWREQGQVEAMTARWHALTHALGMVADAASAAHDAVPRADATTRPYAQEYAAEMDRIRENLLRATIAAAPKDARGGHA